MSDEIEIVNNEGLVSIGEVTTRVMREAISEPDFEHIRRTGATTALNDCLQWIMERIVMAGPYDDTRALREMVTWLGDRIREVNSPQTNGQ